LHERDSLLRYTLIAFLYATCSVRQALFASVIKIQISFTSWSTAGLYEILFCVNGTAEQGQFLHQETAFTATRF